MGDAGLECGFGRGLAVGWEDREEEGRCGCSEADHRGLSSHAGLRGDIRGSGAGAQWGVRRGLRWGVMLTGVRGSAKRAA